MSTLRVSNIEAKADASSPSVNEKVKITNSNGDVLVTVNGETAGITTIFTTLSLGTGTSISSPATNVLTLGTNNAERLRINSSGNIGIGTDNPSQKLHVKGTIQVDGNSTAINDNYSRIYQNSNGSVDYGLQVKHYQGDTNDVDAAIILGGNGSTREGNIVFYRDVSGTFTETARFEENGRLGIGTANTDRVLAVYGIGNLGTQLAIESPDTQSAGLLIKGDRRYEIQSTSPAYSYASSFIVHDRDAGLTRMAIDENGRVSRPYQLWIAGSPNNTTGAGTANAFNTDGFSAPVGLSFSNSRITVPIAGVYLITFTTICDTGTGRQDANILINGTSILSTLNDTDTNGYHYRGASISVKLAANDYIQFTNEDWYAHTSSNQNQPWRRASVYLLG